MKRNYTCLLIALMLFPLAMMAQNNASDQDKWLRASMTYQDDNSIEFTTSYGQAVANLMIKAHKEMLPYPAVNFNQSNGDYQSFLALSQHLSGLRENPPSWDRLIAKEESKMAAKDAPPTPPVYAGDEAAQSFLSGRKGSNGMSSKVHSVPRQTDPGNQTISDPIKVITNDSK